MGAARATRATLKQMLSNKAKYGLKALIHLAGAEGQCLAGDMAAANNIPRKFLDAILVELRNAGILNSRKGKGGSYLLAQPRHDPRPNQHRLLAPARTQGTATLAVRRFAREGRGRRRR